MKKFKEDPNDIIDGEFLEEDIQNEKFNTEEYRAFFEENSFWNKIKEYSVKIGLKGIYFALILYYVLQKDSISLKDKSLIIGALGYLIAPIDFIPDLIPGMGFVDDIGVLTVVIKKISEHIDDKVKSQAKEKLQTWFKNIEDIEKFL